MLRQAVAANPEYVREAQNVPRLPPCSCSMIRKARSRRSAPPSASSPTTPSPTTTWADALPGAGKVPGSDRPCARGRAPASRLSRGRALQPGRRVAVPGRPEQCGDASSRGRPGPRPEYLWAQTQLGHVLVSLGLPDEAQRISSGLRLKPDSDGNPPLAGPAHASSTSRVGKRPGCCWSLFCE